MQLIRHGYGIVEKQEGIMYYAFIVYTLSVYRIYYAWLHSYMCAADIDMS